MTIRSLRWRLVLAMVLIIAAVAGAAGVFSSVTVKRELDRYLVAQRVDDARAALDLFRRSEVDVAMRGAYDRFGFRSVVLNANRVVATYPPELRKYRIQVMRDGSLELKRDGEALRIKGMSTVVRIVRGPAGSRGGRR